MPIYQQLGEIPRKRHIAFRKPDGGLYSEQLVGHEGFSGTSALLYVLAAVLIVLERMGRAIRTPARDASQRTLPSGQMTRYSPSYS